MRLAIVSPLPPAPTGIADYTVDVAHALGSAHEIELFHDQSEVTRDLGAPAFPVGTLPERATPRPFDAVIYQMGNGPAHDFLYGWMERIPGVVVLHDLVLHHAWARRFLETPEARAYAADPSSHSRRERVESQQRAYRDAVEAVHPGLGDRLMDAQLNTTGDLLPYAYPLFEPALAGALAAGAHNAFMLEAILEARPGLPCEALAMPVHARAVPGAVGEGLRARLGLSGPAPIVGAFGRITPEKRIETAARAVARLAPIHPGLRLLLAGAVSDAAWLGGLLDRAGVAGRTVVAEGLDAEEFVAAMEIADAVIHLRYPTARETSAALLRVMAQGRPAVISDLVHQSGIPADAVRRVDLRDEEGGLARALDGLLRNREEAREMGARARDWTARNHSAARTRESYERLLKRSAGRYSEPNP